jgi:hypothetical protein
MRRGWEVNRAFFANLAAVWFVGGLLATFIVGLVWRTHNRHGTDTGAAWVHSPLHWVLPIWLGPFALVGVAAIAYGSAWGLRTLWRHPPVRRVTRPILTDLREQTPAAGVREGARDHSDHQGSE